MKFTVTEELAKLLEALRKQNKITAQRLSAQVEKSPSYISKLEKRSIGSIQEEELIRVFSAIMPGRDFYGEILPAVAREYLRAFGTGGLSRQLWLINLDIVKRELPIPEELAGYLRRQLSQLGIDRQQYACLINKNLDSPTMSGLPKNEFISFSIQDDAELLLIWVEMPEQQVYDVLDGRLTKLPIAMINNMVYVLLREEHYKERDFSRDEGEALLLGCRELLESYGIRPLIPYYEMIIHKNDTHDEMNLNAKLSSQNNELLREIVTVLSTVVESDLLTGTPAISQFLHNLHWDPGFMIKLMCMPYSDMEPVNYTTKAAFLNDLAKLLNKYKQLPDKRKAFEIYE